MDKVVHFELPVDELERARAFYSETFGWELEDIPEMDYTIVTTVPIDENRMPKESGAINGGIYVRAEGISKNPVIVIGVDSIDASLEKIKAQGCEIVLPKNQVGDMGLYAQIRDTEGNVIGIWQDLNQAESEGAGEVELSV